MSMKRVCVFYYGAWSSTIRNRLIAAKPMYVILDLSSWPSVPTADITNCKNAGITMCAYIPTGGMRGFIWSAADTTVKTPANIKALVDQAYSRGFNGIFFDEGGLYTPVSGQTWQDAYLDRYLQAPGRNAGSPPILSVVGNSKYNPTTADSWLGLTVEEYISHAKAKGMFVVVGHPDEYVRSSRLNSNVFQIIDAVLTSEEYNTRAPGLSPVGQEIPFTGQCFVLSYNGAFDAQATIAAINHGFGAAYCCESMGTLSSNFESYMAQIPGEVVPLTFTVILDHTRLLQTAPNSGVNIVQPVVSDLVNFPLKIRIGASVGKNSFDLSAIFDTLGSHWQNLHLEDQNGVSCPMEVVVWDAVSRIAIIYAKVPLVSKATDTILTLFTAGPNPDIGLTRSAAAELVWDSGFVGVWHLVEAGNGTAGEFMDSTSKHHDGRGGGSLLANGTNTGTCPSSFADTLMGFAQRFGGNGSNNWITVPTVDHDWDITNAAGLTVTCLANVDNIAFQGSNYFYQAVQYGNSPNGYQWENTLYSTLDPSRKQWVVPYVYGKTGGLGNGADARQNYTGYPKPAWANNQWLSMGMLIDSPNDPLKGHNIYALYNGIVYRGSSDAGGVFPPADYSIYQDLNAYGGLLYTTAPLVFGSSYNRKAASWGGNIAEIHISNVQRSDSWVAAEHYSGIDTLASYADEPPPTPVAIERGIFHWEWSVSELQNTAELLKFVQSFGFTEIYHQFYCSQLINNGNLIQNLLNALNAIGVKSYGLINHGGINLSHLPDPLEGHVNEGGVLKSDRDLVLAYLQYNATHTKFDGLCFDIEDLKGIADTLIPYMTAVKGYAYSSQTLATQGMELLIYLDPPYYLAGQPYGNAAGVAKAKSLYAQFNKILLNTYRPTAPANVTAAQDGPAACVELDLVYMLGLDCTPGFGNAFDGALATYAAQVVHIDTSTASNIAPYRANYGGTYLNAYNYVIDLWEEAMLNVFAPGAAKVAKVPVTVVPAGVPCELEIFIGPNPTIKTTTSGKIAFTSTGAAQNINCPIAMPTTAGQYHVYVDLTSGGYLLAAYVDLNDIAILSGSVGPIVWT